MKHIQFASPRVVEHIPEKVAALDRANKRLARLLPDEFFRCVLLSQRMSRVACAKSYSAAPRIKTVKGKLSSHTGKVSPPSASMRPANGCSTCPIGAEHYRGRIPEGVPAVAPLVPHASAGLVAVSPGDREEAALAWRHTEWALAQDVADAAKAVERIKGD